MADESKSKASRVASEVAPTEQNSTALYDQGQGQDEGPDPGQDPGQYQSQGQVGGKAGGKCMCNPCKCCCGSNLRSACFSISITELVLAGGVLILLLTLALGGNGQKKEQHNPNVPYRKTNDHGNDVDDASATPVVAVVATVLALLLGMGISLLLGVIKRMKCSCLFHTGCASILAALMFSGVILSIVLIVMVDTPAVKNVICKDLYSPQLPDNSPGPGRGSGPGSSGNSNSAAEADRSCDTIITGIKIAVGVLLVFCLIFATLYAYFAANSTALYCHYKNGVLYENTSLCNCCGSRNRMQPQYQYQFVQAQPQGQYQYQNQWDPNPNPAQSQNQMETAPSYTEK